MVAAVLRRRAATFFEVATREDGSCVEVLALRHGQSEWNAEGRWQGQADPPLTSLGEQQALFAAQQLLDSGEFFDTIASSDLQRARRTAEIIAEIVGNGIVKLRTEFRERSAGPWQGLTRAEIEMRWPDAIAQKRWPDGYESDESVISRVVPAIYELATTSDCLLVIAHAGLIRALDRASNAPPTSVPNLSGRWYRLEERLVPGNIVNFSAEATSHGIE